MQGRPEIPLEGHRPSHWPWLIGPAWIMDTCGSNQIGIRHDRGLTHTHTQTYRDSEGASERSIDRRPWTERGVRSREQGWPETRGPQSSGQLHPEPHAPHSGPGFDGMSHLSSESLPLAFQGLDVPSMAEPPPVLQGGQDFRGLERTPGPGRRGVLVHTFPSAGPRSKGWATWLPSAES